MKTAIRFRVIGFSFLAILFLAAAFTAFALPETPAFGADTVQDLFSPDLAGQGTFVTSRGSAPFSAINPAQAGQTDRMILNAGAIGVTNLNIASELGGIFDLGLLYPTKSATFSGTLRYYYFDQFKTDFPLKNELGGNFSVAKEFFPQFSLGAGINFGAGPDNWTLSADLGLLQNLGNLGFMKNFTWAFVLRNMGMSWAPTWFTPWLGVTFDFLQIEGKGGKPDPLIVNFAADVGVPSVIVPENINVIAKAGITVTILEQITLSVLWPGAAGYNMRESQNENRGHFQWFPSVGMGINFIIPSDGKRQHGEHRLSEYRLSERRPSDGDITFDAVFKPLYYDVYATGAGVTWYAGYRDDLPPNIVVDYPETQYISPNYDGKSDSLVFPVRIVDDHYVMSWVMTIKDSNGSIVRTYRNKDRRFEMMNARDIYGRYYMEKKGVDVPPNMRWDGIFNTGEIGPDGKYYFSISAADENGNVGTSPSSEVILKNTLPQVTIDNINLNDRIFDPSGESRGGNKTSINIVSRGTAEDKWESGIYNSEGKLIRTFAPTSGSPQPQIWDGKTDSGGLAPDGAYTFRITATDKAQNTGFAVMSNIVVDTRTVGAILTASANAIAPKTDQTAEKVRFNDRLNRTDGIASWKLEIKNDKNDIVKIFEGSGASQGGIGRPPENFSWNGLSDNGSIREGLVFPELTVNYLDGHVANAKSTPILIDSTGPGLDLLSSPDLFSPDNDGVNDVLSIRLKAEDVSPIARWSLDIYEPVMENGTNPVHIFKHFEGSAAPVEELMWNGRGNSGDLVQSAVDYPYVYTATDTLGNTSVKRGAFGIDVLVIREGDQFRIQIPSIVFPADSAVFDGLNQSTLDNNIRVIKRVAQILNKFKNYKVMVEGHANPTTASGPAREQEEPSLKDLSEKRAGYVLEQLVRNSVARNRLSFTGAGGSMPIVPFEDHSGWWKNRRVDFILIR
jgi:outer membrane protein OmpA-like peptidoglycan-associated protein/flagellar hook assembly protein FlgD